MYDNNLNMKKPRKYLWFIPVINVFMLFYVGYLNKKPLTILLGILLLIFYPISYLPVLIYYGIYKDKIYPSFDLMNDNNSFFHQVRGRNKKKNQSSEDLALKRKPSEESKMVIPKIPQQIIGQKFEKKIDYKDENKVTTKADNKVKLDFDKIRAMRNEINEMKSQIDIFESRIVEEEKKSTSVDGTLDNVNSTKADNLFVDLRSTEMEIPIHNTANDINQLSSDNDLAKEFIENVKPKVNERLEQLMNRYPDVFTTEKKVPQKNIPVRKPSKPDLFVQPIEQKKSSKSHVALNFDRIRDLREESEDVRQALEVENKQDNHSGIKFTTEEMASVRNSLSQDSLELIRTLSQNSWRINKRSGYEFAINEINRISEYYIAHSLLIEYENRIILENDFREYWTAQFPEADTSGDSNKESLESKKASVLFNLNAMSNEMRELVQALNEVQEKALHAVLSKGDVNIPLKKIADDSMTMPEVILDEINEVSLSIIDDILIETQNNPPFVFDIYADQLSISIG